MKTPNFFILFVVVIGMLLIAGCTQQQTVPSTPQPTATPTATPAADNIKLMNTNLGKVLTDANGMTLYYFITDTPANGTSTCYAATNCSHFWPVFSVDTVLVSPPLSKGDFSSMTRTDGTNQTTYFGWPLYYFLNDKVPGDVKGENVLKTWYVAKPDYTVMIASAPGLGAFLTDPFGKTLYTFIQDTTGTSTCTGACLTKWPAFSADQVIAPSVLKTSDFAPITRTDGVKQWAYMGKPLYYYSGDSRPGMTNGQGFANKWNVANITGFVYTVPTTAQTAIPTTIRTINTGTGDSGSSSGGGY
jgi:predicted lipoprotein with Yx(FWY)xxD motif